MEATSPIRPQQMFPSPIHPSTVEFQIDTPPLPVEETEMTGGGASSSASGMNAPDAEETAFERSRSPKKTFKQRMAAMDHDETGLFRRQVAAVPPDAVSLMQDATPLGKRDHDAEPGSTEPEVKTPRRASVAQSKSKIQYEALRASRDNQKARIIYQALTHSGKAQVRKPKELYRNRLPGDPAIWQEACSREWGDWAMHEAVGLEPHPEPVDPILIMPMRHLYVDKNAQARNENPTLEVLARARLLVPGFKDPYWQQGLVRTMAPTLSNYALKLVLLYAAANGWSIDLGDVSSAFLNGFEISRDLWCSAPPEGLPATNTTPYYPPGTVFKIKKGVYGITDAPKMWYDAKAATLRESGMLISQVCPTLFLCFDDSKVEVVPPWSLQDPDRISALRKLTGGWHMVDRAMVHVGTGMQSSSWSPFHALGQMRSIAIQEAQGDNLEIIEDNALYTGNLSYNTRVNKSIVVFQDAGERRRLIGLLGSHVDDDIVTGTQAFKDQVIQGVLNKVYRYKWVSDDYEQNHKTTAVLTFTGIQIRRSEDGGVLLNQRSYILGLSTLPMSLHRRQDVDSKLQKNEFDALRSGLAAAAWVTRHSRPDKAFQVAKGLQRLNEATVLDFQEYNQMVLALQREPDVSIKLPPLAGLRDGSLADLIVIAVSDASWNNLISQGKKEVTQAGMVILLGSRQDFVQHGMGPVGIVGWRSHKLKRVTRSTMHGEAQGLNEACSQGDLFRCLLVESVIGRDFRLAHWRYEVRAVAMTGVTDCKDVESSLWKGGNAEDPRVELEMRCLYLEQDSGLEYRWTATIQMPADSLTKNSTEASLYLRDVMDRAYFSWVLDAEAAARKERLKARKKALKFQMPVKKVRELKQLNVTPDRLTATVARRGAPAETATNSSMFHWVVKVYDYTLDHITSGVFEQFWQSFLVVVLALCTECLRRRWSRCRGLCSRRRVRSSDASRGLLVPAGGDDAPGGVGHADHQARALQSEQSSTRHGYVGVERTAGVAVRSSEGTPDPRPRISVANIPIEERPRVWLDANGRWRDERGRFTRVPSASASPSSSVRSRPEAVVSPSSTEPQCPQCGGPMVRRVAGHGGSFFGCRSFPQCRGTRSLREASARG